MRALRCVLLAACIAVAAYAGARVGHRVGRVPPPESAPRRLTVAFMGEDEGRLEPCGCTPAMLGGLARRPARLAASREPDVPMIVVSGGRLVEGDDKYDQMRLRVIFDALSSMHCTSFAPSVITVGGFTINIATLDRDAAASGTWVRSMRAEPGRREPLVLLEPAIVLTAMDAPAAHALARDVAGPTLILYAGGITDPRDDDATGGAVAVAPYPAHGKYVGFAHLSGAGAAARWTIEYRPVVHDLPEDPAIVQMKTALLDEMRAAGLVAKHSSDARFVAGAVSATTGAFVGNEACAQCHAEDVRLWSESRHARAMASLRATGDDADPGCVKCHVVGYGTGLGFVSEKKTPQFAEVGCEACHGPRAQHVETRRAGLIDDRSVPAGEESCAACHDGEHSPDFDFAAAWPRIAHGKK